MELFRLRGLKRFNFSLFFVMTIAVILLAVSACSEPPVEVPTAPEVGSRTPSFEAKFLNGDTEKIDDILENGVILNFWATWCGPCRREMPLLTQLADRSGDDGVMIIAVNTGEIEETIRPFLDEFNVNFPVALDIDGSITRLYAVPALPMTFFIDGDGIIQYRRVGELKEGHITEGLARIAGADTSR